MNLSEGKITKTTAISINLANMGSAENLFMEMIGTSGMLSDWGMDVSNTGPGDRYVFELATIQPSSKDGNWSLTFRLRKIDVGPKESKF